MRLGEYLRVISCSICLPKIVSLLSTLEVLRSRVRLRSKVSADFDWASVRFGGAGVSGGRGDLSRNRPVWVSNRVS